jgi:protein-S-isoprenylcysteine O-methyltransferase Ste14
MGGLIGLLYGIIAYLIFLGTFLYAVGFAGNIIVPKTIDSGVAGPMGQAILVNTLLLGLFAVQHSVMARPAFKRWWTRIVPKSMERSTYVLLASAVLILLFWLWEPIPQVVWSVSDPIALTFIHAVFWLGWAILLLATFLINHFELFGLSQVFAALRRQPPAPTAFRAPLLYRFTRHPIYLGFLLSFWAAPVMTLGHLLFSLGSTGYILLGIFLEERDLVAQFGEQYRSYRRKVGMFWPRFNREPAPARATDSPSHSRS